MVGIGVSGAAGRMGRRIISLAKQDSSFALIFGLEVCDHNLLGEKIEDISIISDYSEIKNCNCLIEFSTPQATLEHLSFAVKFKKSLVIGTTGFNQDELIKINQAASLIPIVLSPNMSVGVNVLFRITREAAKILKDHAIYLEEAHHIHKKDAPSGTAKKIAQILREEGFSINEDDIVPIREGEIVGDHSVMFKSNLDELEISHSAKTRDIFAKGALTAAKWVVGKPPGLYSMDDVLFGEKI
ncbi:MAG: 4-hydroxy-tetrahydrodipicolinate reductase [Candidatus Omnitrophota bacterium]